MNSIEKSILRVGLVLALSYQLFQTLFSIWNGGESSIVSLNLLITVAYLFLLYPLSSHTQIVAFVFHCIVLAGFAFFWMNTTGFDETVPAMMCVYFAFISVVSRRYYRIAALLLHAILVYVLLFSPGILQQLRQFDLTNLSLTQLSIEYGAVALFIAVFVCYMKVSYQSFHANSKKKYEQLEAVESTLHRQNQELQSRQEEVRMINENLESIVQERAGQIEIKNKELSEYAFINAHMLRGPLSRVIGIAILMERAPDVYPPAKVNEIKNLANEMDLIVREITLVLH